MTDSNPSVICQDMLGRCPTTACRGRATAALRLLLRAPDAERYVSKNRGTMNMSIFSTFLSLISLSLASCSTLPSAFSTENVMKVHQGMSSDEILMLFGKPKSISASVCGRPPDQWKCTTWEYGEFPYDRATFTFSGEHSSLELNNFKVDRH